MPFFYVACSSLKYKAEDFCLWNQDNALQHCLIAANMFMLNEEAQDGSFTLNTAFTPWSNDPMHGYTRFIILPNKARFLLRQISFSLKVLIFFFFFSADKYKIERESTDTEGLRKNVLLSKF